MTEKLKYCPFCGGEAILLWLGNIAEGDWIKCVSCECQTKLYSTTSEAIEAWNRRAER